MPSTPFTAVLLGAQRSNPSLRSVVASLGVEGRIACITAGWQELESEDEELARDLDGRTVNLQLHARGDALFREDQELLAAHRQRQELLRHLQDLYRIRIEHALEAERVVRAHGAPEKVRDEVEQASIETIRTIDAWHLEQCARIHEDFNKKWDLARRPSVSKQRAELHRVVEECSAIAIAGGHVATLINRFLLFDVRGLIGKRAVFAWSGGAMALTDRIVLFHDDPPQGPGFREVLDAGLGIVPGVVVFPEPEQRLRLDDKERVRLLARRFAPATCLALPARSHVVLSGARATGAEGVLHLATDGSVKPFNERVARARGDR